MDISYEGRWTSKNEEKEETTCSYNEAYITMHFHIQRIDDIELQGDELTIRQISEAKIERGAVHQSDNQW